MRAPRCHWASQERTWLLLFVFNIYPAFVLQAPQPCSLPTVPARRLSKGHAQSGLLTGLGFAQLASFNHERRQQSFSAGAWHHTKKRLAEDGLLLLGVSFMAPSPNHLRLNVTCSWCTWWIAPVRKHEVQVMCAQVQHQGDLRSITAYVLNERAIGTTTFWVHPHARPRVQGSVAPNDVPVLGNIPPSIVCCQPATPGVRRHRRSCHHTFPPASVSDLSSSRPLVYPLAPASCEV